MSLGIYDACAAVVELESRIQVERKNNTFRARAAKLLGGLGLGRSSLLAVPNVKLRQ